MTYNTILLARDNGLATLTLNAPDKLNAVSRKMIAEIKTCWEELAADTSVRAVLLTGAGRGFCAGADLADPDREASATADSGAALDKYFNPVIRLMRSIPKPDDASRARALAQQQSDSRLLRDSDGRSGSASSHSAVRPHGGPDVSGNSLPQSPMIWAAIGAGAMLLLGGFIVLAVMLLR